MRICGFAAEGLRSERRIHETFPVKELQDYWSSRPRYEDVNPKSKEFRSGSLLSDKSEADGEDPGGGGQTYQEWLALQQKEQKDDVPPPPYTLESVESIPPQTVTNGNTHSSTVTTTAEVPVRNSPAVTNVQPPVSLSDTAARPAVNTNTYPGSHAASSSHAVLSSSIPAASPPTVNMNTYPTSAAPAERQEAYSQVSAQSPQPLYPPAQGHSPGSVHYPQSVAPSQGYSPQQYPPGVSQPLPPSHSHLPQSSYPPAQGPSPGGVHHPQSGPPSQGYSPQPYPPGVSQYSQSHLPSHSHSPHASSGQPVQSYPPPTEPQRHQQYQPQNFQPYPPTSGQASVWGQQPQPYPPGGPSYQGYPTATGYSQGYPSTGAPSQGYTPSVTQPYPPSGGPVNQGYPPVDVQGHQNTYQIRNQSQDSVTELTNEFGRQNISNPSGVSSAGGFPPPPLHPTRPVRHSSSSTKPSSPVGVGVSSGGKLPAPPPLHPNHPNRPPPSSLKPSAPSNYPSRPQSQTGHHHAATPQPVSSSSGQITSTATTTANRPRWPPVEWDSDTPPVQKFSGHKPSTHGHVGATLTRPQTVGPSSSIPTGGSTLRPTLSMSARPPSRPDTNMPSAAYVSETTTHSHDYSDNNVNPISFPTGPAKYEQYFSYPDGPQYNTYMPPGQQAYGSWPGPERVSPPPTFPVSSMAYGPPGSSYGSGIESQYPGTTSSGSAGGGERLNFPEGPGGSYFDGSSSSSYPAPWTSTSGSPVHSRK